MGTFEFYDSGIRCVEYSVSLMSEEILEKKAASSLAMLNAMTSLWASILQPGPSNPSPRHAHLPHRDL
ncbi:Retrograde Golgi transport protein RGP1 -like protein [Caligus rogercresseyi]|uniref:Retrograde Golgi transport protein RGP1 -like protein n=1 Tax=Caligus rogercresseyi TaxID=217165 RepID=A0A7T8GY52_CALRO|nr:Retrograde Golgi transport protein RGP1 -like protein [Caligus rogercresseyi]